MLFNNLAVGTGMATSGVKLVKSLFPALDVSLGGARSLVIRTPNNGGSFADGAGAPVTIKGVPASETEVLQGQRFGTLVGGGEMDFGLIANSQGIEGYFTQTGTGVRIPVSFKTLDKVGRLSNLNQTITKNAKQIGKENISGAVFYAEPTQFGSVELGDFLFNGGSSPALRMIDEGQITRMIFQTKDGVVNVAKDGVTMLLDNGKTITHWR